MAGRMVALGRVAVRLAVSNEETWDDSLFSIFKNHLGNGLGWSVGNRKRCALHPQLGGEFGGASREKNCWAPARFTADFDIAPGNAALPSCADGFEGGLFGGKAGRVSLDPVGLGIAVADFGGGEDALQKALAKALNGAPDAGDFDDVNAGADDHVC